MKKNKLIHLAAIFFSLAGTSLHSESLAIWKNNQTVLVIDPEIILNGSKVFPYVKDGEKWVKMKMPVPTAEKKEEVIKFLIEFSEAKSKEEILSLYKEDSIVRRRIFKSSITGERFGEAFGNYAFYPKKLNTVYISWSEDPGAHDGKEPYGTYETVKVINPIETSYADGLNPRAVSGKDGMIVQWNRHVVHNPPVLGYKIYRKEVVGKSDFQLVTPHTVGVSFLDTAGVENVQMDFFNDENVKEQTEYSYRINAVLLYGVEEPKGVEFKGFFEGKYDYTKPEIQRITQKGKELLIEWKHNQRGVSKYSIHYYAPEMFAEKKKNKKEEKDNGDFYFPLAVNLGSQNLFWTGTHAIDTVYDTEATFQVRAEYQAGQVMVSEDKTHPVRTEYKAPEIKVKKAQLSKDYKKFKIEWEKPKLHKKFKIVYYQIRRGNGTFTQEARKDTTWTGFTDKEITPGLRYDYSIVAFDKYGDNIAESQYIRVEIPDYKPPEEPEIFAIDDVTEKRNVPVAKLFFRVSHEQRIKTLSLLKKDGSGKTETIPLKTGDSFYFDQKLKPGQKYRYKLEIVGVGGQKIASKEVEYKTKDFEPYPVDKIEGWHDYRQGNVIKWYYFFPKHNDHYVLIYRREKSESTDFVQVNATPLPIKSHKYIDKVTPGSYEYHIVSTDVTGKIKSPQSWPLFIDVPAPN